ncbi:metallophosphoesterase [Kitasatospora sp. NPDC088160]|uniref:metallophosphoesterase n=1 Tax=Kitasatospora sp. NPDC088160 TaxID=3364072 RepID=UPI0037FB158E
MNAIWQSCHFSTLGASVDEPVVFPHQARAHEATHEPGRSEHRNHRHRPDIRPAPPGRSGARSFVGHEPDDGLAAVLADAKQAITDAALVVATGDLTDIGEPVAYERMGEVLDALPTPVYCLAGNHDRQDTLQACLPRPNVHVEPAVRLGNWLMLFLDTNAHGREAAADGTYRDRDDRVHAARPARPRPGRGGTRPRDPGHHPGGTRLRVAAPAAAAPDRPGRPELPRTHRTDERLPQDSRDRRRPPAR